MTKAQYEALREKYRIVINGLVIYPDNYNGSNGFSDFGSLNSKVYAYEPSRSGDFTMRGLNEIPTSEPPQLQIRFKYLSAENYRKLKQAIKPNEFVVEFYDIEYDTRRTMKMYVKPDSLKLIFGAWSLDKLGILDQTLDFVATLNDIDLINITFNSNYDTPTTIGLPEMYYGQEYKLLQDTAFTRSGYTIEKWNTSSDGSGTDYAPGMSAIALTNQTFYAIWKSQQERKIFLQYLNAEPALDNINQPITVIPIILGSPIRGLPNITPKDVQFNGQTITPPPYNTPYKWTSFSDGTGREWDNGQYYTVNGTQESANIQGDSVIYAYMQPKQFTLTFDSKGGNYTPDPITAPYMSLIIKPYTPTKINATFGGWYYTDESTEVDFAFTTMPPKNLNLIARWNNA